MPDSELRDVGKPTQVYYRPNAKYHWMIAQGTHQIKLTDEQIPAIIKSLLESSDKKEKIDFE
jgi:hypothetical protein